MRMRGLAAVACLAEGGTMITWSTYFQGIGEQASPSQPIKAECYVVQSTGIDHERREVTIR